MMDGSRRRTLFLTVAAATAVAAAARGDADLLIRAADYLAAGEGEKATVALIAYGRGEPAAPLANQALDAAFLLFKKAVAPAALAPYVEALALLAEGYVATADASFREMAAAEETPWPVRGRAALVAAELNTRGDRVALLAAAWAECDGDTGRLLAIALADAYYKAGAAAKALAVREEFVKRFGDDEGLKYFDYLLAPAEEGK